MRKIILKIMVNEMIDLELERKAFEELSYKNGVRNFTKDEADGGYCSAELDYNWHIWIKSAESKQPEIDLLRSENPALKEKLQKLESGEFVVVPREPCSNVIKFIGGSKQEATLIYKAMIEAAKGEAK